VTDALSWQKGIWDQYPETYLREVDKRFAPLVEGVTVRAALRPGLNVLDLGTGTGSVALRAAALVAPGGHVLGVDISREMLAAAQGRAKTANITNITFREGGGEAIPEGDGAVDVLLASLSIMYMTNRAAAAREIARVLSPGGRFVAAVWADPEHCDIVLFQQTAGRFAPTPPVPGVGPGALADPNPFLLQLEDAGIHPSVETDEVEFEFDSFASAWDILARVTTSGLEREKQQQAKAAVLATMWPRGDGPRRFRNRTQFIVGRLAG
jgi:enediyne biosynthesis protein CalE5